MPKLTYDLIFIITVTRIMTFAGGLHVVFQSGCVDCFDP